MPEPNSSISSFKQFLIRILLPLILIVSGCGYIFNFFFEKKIVLQNQGCGAYKVNRIINSDYPDEIPIFGSSRAEGGVIPDSLGKNYFNYGLSGSKYDVTLFFLEQECMKKKTTPWIILNLDLDGLLYGLGDIANYIPNSGLPPVKSLLGEEYRAYFRLPLLKYYGRFETYVRSYVNEQVELTKVMDKGASIEKNELPSWEFAELVTQRRNSPTLFICDTLLTQKLFRLITTHADRKFVFIISPYHSSFFDKFLNPEMAIRFTDTLRSFSNVSLFDFSKMPLSDSMFLNTSHLNFKGAVVFNRQLRDSLKAIGVK